MINVSGEDFTVVVITRNRRSILLQCLERLELQSVLPNLVIVVDSSDTFEPLSRTRTRHVHFPPGRNQMPRARNEGTRLASTTYIAFIDDDCLVDHDWLENLIVAFSADSELAGVGGRISDRRYQYDPNTPIGRVTESGQLYSNFFGDSGGCVEVDFLPGGNMAFHRDWLMKVGGFDPGFVATNHREDPDICLRLGSCGARLMYQPAAHALHLNARTLLDELKPWHEFYLRYSFARNEAYFFARHYPRHALRRWLDLCAQQSSKALNSGSLVAGLCVIVQFFSYPLGLVSYLVQGRSSPRHKPSS